MDRVLVQEKSLLLAKIIFSWTKTLNLSHFEARMNLEENIRQLIEQAQKDPPHLRLSQIATLAGVEYNRVWRFMSKDHPNTLLAADAQALYEKLSGKPLLLKEDETL